MRPKKLGRTPKWDNIAHQTIHNNLTINTFYTL